MCELQEKKLPYEKDGETGKESDEMVQGRENQPSRRCTADRKMP